MYIMDVSVLRETVGVGSFLLSPFSAPDMDRSDLAEEGALTLLSRSEPSSSLRTLPAPRALFGSDKSCGKPLLVGWLALDGVVVVALLAAAAPPWRNCPAAATAAAVVGVVADDDDEGGCINRLSSC